MGAWAITLAKLLLPKLAPYVVAILAVLTFVGVAYVKGKQEADRKLTIERLNQENAQLRSTIEKHRAVLEADNKVAAENEKRLAELEALSRKVIEGVKEPSNQCLDADDTDRLRELWGENVTR